MNTATRILVAPIVLAVILAALFAMPVLIGIVFDWCCGWISPP